MAKTYTDSYYEMQWTGKVTGWDYTLFMYPSDTADFGVTRARKLYEQCNFIQDLKYGWEFEKYQHGTCTQYLDITFNMDFVPDGDSLEECITDPYADLSFNYEPGAGWAPGTSIPMEFTTGNRVKLYIDFKDEDTQSGTRLVYEGVQKTGLEQGIKKEQFNLFKVQTVDKFRSISEAVDMANLQYYYLKDSAYETDRTTLEWIHRPGNVNYANGTIPPSGDDIDYNNTRFWFVKLYDRYYPYLETLYEQVGQKFERDAFNAGMSPDLTPTMYKQNYLLDGTKGAEIGSSAVYLTGFVADGLSTTDTVYEGVMYNDLVSDFDNLYDYFTDLSHGYLKTLWYDYNTETLDQIDLLHSTSVELDEQSLWDYELIPHAEVLQKAAGEPLEYIDSDVSSVEAVNQGSRSKTSAALPIIFNNTPPASDNIVHDMGGTKHDSSAWFDVKAGRFISRTTRGHLRNLYYKDTPNVSGDLTSKDKFIRIHEWVNFNLGDSITSDSIEAFAAFTPSFAHWNNLDSIDLQNQSGFAYIIANTYLQLYGGKKQCKLKAKCYLNEGVSLTEANDSIKECQWFYPRAVRFDPATLNPEGKTMYDKFRTNSTSYAEFPLTKVEVDFKEETVDFEGISRTHYA